MYCMRLLIEYKNVYRPDIEYFQHLQHIQSVVNRTCWKSFQLKEGFLIGCGEP